MSTLHPFDAKEFQGHTGCIRQTPQSLNAHYREQQSAFFHCLGYGTALFLIFLLGTKLNSSPCLFKFSTAHTVLSVFDTKGTTLRHYII